MTLAVRGDSLSRAISPKNAPSVSCASTTSVPVSDVLVIFYAAAGDNKHRVVYVALPNDDFFGEDGAHLHLFHQLNEGVLRQVREQRNGGQLGGGDFVFNRDDVVVRDLCNCLNRGAAPGPSNAADAATCRPVFLA